MISDLIRSCGLLCQILVLLMVICILRCLRVKKMLRTHFLKESLLNYYVGESSSSVDDAQYYGNVIGEHVYKPDVPVQFIPFKGLIFKSFELAIKMYSEYAEIGGFDKKKYCDTFGTSGVRRKRNSNSRVIVYQAKIIFEYVYGTSNYKVFQFDELHNHPLDLKKARQMSYSEKEFILRASLRGGYEFVKPKVVDYETLRRDINRVICYKDAQMIVNVTNDRRAHYLNYSFEFNCLNDVLDSMFWADEMEKTYYAEFGDVISYRMIFLPFTAIDHHKKSVTFGAGLLSNKSMESYSWLHKSFLMTHVKEPTLGLTDQDVAIKQAIENHIMKKLKNKLFTDKYNDILTTCLQNVIHGYLDILTISNVWVDEDYVEGREYEFIL
uniref:MULE transposase domain-containing protein n=1 Tax=Lactuca sativa TaxID=4236 RepID=A0A9R1URL5_LACSA|nr:hypothetical protein LSAT_V11C800452080 [Lactuca sativa]